MSSNYKYDSLGYYQVLNVTSASSDEDIRQSYRDLAKYWHPDHNTNSNAVDMFQKISIAYDVLKNPETRLKYNLLSFIYSAKDFPEMNSLCILKNMHGQNDINLKALYLSEITGKGFGHSKITKTYYCNFSEALTVVKQITRHNWLYGFWGISAFFINLWAIFHNLIAFYNRDKNFFLYLHNSLAFKDEGMLPEALTSALLAKDFASKDVLPFLNLYIQKFSNITPLNLKKWNLNKLRRIQLFYPFLIFICILIGTSFLYLKNLENSKRNTVNVKEVVVLENGQRVFSDVAVAKIFDIPVDVYDKQKLYHLTDDATAMHGADKSFDIFKTIEKGTTVRLTGYTADQKWYRVMFDSGEMAFIEASKLTQGIGNPIPLWSKIYKE